MKYPWQEGERKKERDKKRKGERKKRKGGRKEGRKKGRGKRKVKKKEKWISSNAVITGALPKEKKSGSSGCIFRLLYKWSNKHFCTCCGKENTHGTTGIKHYNGY